jgi:hypothetical protein
MIPWHCLKTKMEVFLDISNPLVFTTLSIEQFFSLMVSLKSAQDRKSLNIGLKKIDAPW